MGLVRTSPPLDGPLTLSTMIPTGQRSTQELRAFFMAVGKGRKNGWRFKDWGDYTAAHSGAEAGVVLGALCALYAAFVAAQLVGVSSGSRHILESQGLTYAEYAREGFFQLLWAAAITVVVLLCVRACTGRAR